MRLGVLLPTLLLASAQARAQDSDTVTAHLIQILVKNGVLTAKQAQVLLEEAKREAHATATPPSAPPPPAAPPTATTALKPAVPGSVHVTYIPETVRRQIEADVKQQVMQQAQDEGWAQPNVIPDWTQRVRVYGDVRTRADWTMFPNGNKKVLSQGPLFPDFNSINNSSNGYDLAGTAPLPQLNTTEDRFYPGLRVRLGVAAQITDWIDTDVRLGTGVGTNPVSANQVLGQPGDFRGYAIWLDRGDIVLRPDSHVTTSVGRMPDPYWASDLMYDPDLNFDGLAVQGHVDVTDRLGAFLTIGGFPVFNTDFNLGSTNTAKTSSHDQWLVAAQAGVDWRASQDVETRFAAGYFAYLNVQGKVSQPCVDPTSYGSCSTDGTRATYVPFGNTLFAIRDVDTATSSAIPEYYGLASRFDIVDLRGRVVYSGFHPIDVTPEVEFAENLGFNRKQILSLGPVVAQGPANNVVGSDNRYVGGNQAYSVRVSVGELEPAKPWDWKITAGYKYLSSDSVLGALTDSKFHLGGTNSEGYFLIGTVGIAHNVTMSARLYSTTVVSGPAYSVDSGLLELNASF